MHAAGQTISAIAEIQLIQKSIVKSYKLQKCFTDWQWPAAGIVSNLPKCNRLLYSATGFGPGTYVEKL
jgi:hypothetical protein